MFVILEQTTKLGFEFFTTFPLSCQAEVVDVGSC